MSSLYTSTVAAYKCYWSLQVPVCTAGLQDQTSIVVVVVVFVGNPFISITNLKDACSLVLCFSTWVY